ncbi:MAG: fibronectin type III domain-containing protein, partial [Chloroflexi bacterium]|nr:fibronectin type III domain-containing protein [Chloroflexota bacterium]
MAVASAPGGIPQPLSSAASAGVIIYEVQATNVRDTSFNVSWTTNQLTTGEVHYGTDPANLAQTAYDKRGATTSDDTHYAILTGLTPETAYYFDVVS